MIELPSPQQVRRRVCSVLNRCDSAVPHDVPARPTLIRAFTLKLLVSFGNRRRSRRAANVRIGACVLPEAAAPMGPFLATQSGMVHETYVPEQRTGVAGLLRVIRAFAEASLVAIAFAFAILLIGLPFALLGRLVHDLIMFVVGQ